MKEYYIVECTQYIYMKAANLIDYIINILKGCIPQGPSKGKYLQVTHELCENGTWMNQNHISKGH